MGDGVFRCVGRRVAGEEGSKPLWPVRGKETFGISSQAQATKAVLRVGIDQQLPLQPFDHFLLIRFRAGEAAYQTGGELAGEGNEGQEKVGQRVRGRQFLGLV